MGLQLRGPAFGEYRLVAQLGGFHAGRQIGARTDAFHVHHPRIRLAQHPVPGRPHAEGQVGVFVIGRSIVGIKAAQFVEQRPRDHQRRTRAVVHVGGEAQQRVVGIGKAAGAFGATVAEHAAARFLQAAIRIQQLRAHQADARVFAKAAQQRVQPARLGHRVVVQEHQVLAPGQPGAVVAGGDEAAVFRPAVIAQPLYLR